MHPSAGSTTTTTLQALGDLMNAPQRSCTELFECSCPEPDTLTPLARASGADGSRLTGAGWGGCTVSLVPEEKVDEFIQKVKEGYTPYHNFEGDALHEVIFATKPSSGACGMSVCSMMCCGANAFLRSAQGRIRVRDWSEGAVRQGMICNRSRCFLF